MKNKLRQLEYMAIQIILALLCGVYNVSIVYIRKRLYTFNVRNQEFTSANSTTWGDVVTWEIQIASNSFSLAVQNSRDDFNKLRSLLIYSHRS
jgi:hypothetical protein